MERSFRRGTASAKEAATSGGASNRIPFFGMKDKELVHVRFLTDAWEWITVDVHNMYPTKPQPPDYQGNWPRVMSPVCRRTRMGDGLPLFDDCYCCSNPQMVDGKPKRPGSRTWALGVMREEVTSDGSEAMGGESRKGKRIGFRDKTREVDKIENGKPTGEKETVKDIRLFTMGWRNFYAGLEGAAQVYQTILDRDFAIIRNGADKDTTYSITGMDPIRTSKGVTDLRDPEYAARYGIKINLENVDSEGHPEKIYPDELDLGKLVRNAASVDFYNRFIDPRGGSVKHPLAEEQEQAPQNDVTDETLLAMQDRIRSAQPSKEKPAEDDFSFDSGSEQMDFDE